MNETLLLATLFMPAEYYGNMFTVEKLQSKFGSRSIIIAMSKLSEDELKALLVEDNIEAISTIIDDLAFTK